MEVCLIALEVPRHHVKAVKTALESKNQRNREFKIQSKDEHSDNAETFVIHTLIHTYGDCVADNKKLGILENLGLLDLAAEIEITTYASSVDDSHHPRPKQGIDALSETIQSYLTSLGAQLLSGASYGINDLITRIPHHYSIYGPLLILPFDMFSGAEWSDLIANRATKKQHDDMFAAIAQAFQVTNVAIQSRIPGHVDATNSDGAATVTANVQRRPHIEPVCGSFGSFVAGEPTAQDFQDAFWISAKQNGIVQVWAPLYTMFSRGNVKEKARILTMPSVTALPPAGAHGQCAVDMYAGIGYFAFSYLKAGVQKVICFEINPWSVNGLKRGASANRWKFSTAEAEEITSTDVSWKESLLADPETRLLLFQADNKWAKEVVDTCRNELPPVRHVNLGLLPSSEASWRDAVYVLDEREGGWLHVHQNIREDVHFGTSIERIRRQIEIYAESRWHEAVNEGRVQALVSVQLQHVEKVKSYAPGEFVSIQSYLSYANLSTSGIVHCVLDIYIKPNLSGHAP